MFKIEIPVTIRQIMATLFLLKIWSNEDETTVYERGPKLFYYLYLMSFIVSLALGAHLTDDKDERIFLLVPAIAGVVLIYKLRFFLWKQNTIFVLAHEIGTHSTNDQNSFIHAKNKLNILMKFIRYFMLLLFIGAIFATILFPLVSEKRLALNIAFPLKRSNSATATWLAFAYATGGLYGAAAGCSFSPIIWYLLHGFVLKYGMLGNQFRNMGMSKTQENCEPKTNNSLARKQKLYAKDLVAALETYDEINGKLEKFTSIFTNLFFLQIATSSLCICGSVHSLAFSSHEDLIQDVMYCVLLAFCLFDIFVLMYLANDITLYSGQLLYCLFESDWTNQTQSTKKSILILGERLKQPQEIIVGKIYPLNLVTFNSIVNSAYSMFNILQNFRK